MMQSILLATPTKATVSDINSDTKVGETTESVDGKGVEDKASSVFSAVLEKLLKGDEELTVESSEELALEGSEEGESDLESTLELSDEELLPENIDEEIVADSDLEPVLDLETELDLDLQNPEELVNESEPADIELTPDTKANKLTLQENDLSADSISQNDGPLQDDSLADADLVVATKQSSNAEKGNEVDASKQGEKLPVSESSESPELSKTMSASPVSTSPEAIPDEKNISPIIAQIENAQKIDTKVSDINTQPQPKEAITVLDGSLKTTKELSSKADNQKSGKITFENVLSDEGELSDPIAKEQLSKDLLLKDNLRHADKLDSIISSLKTEGEKPVFNQNQEVPVLRSMGAINSLPERLSNQVSNANSTPLMQSAALQQPIELQAKHASKMVGERILMMLNHGKQEVTIRLDPAELGSMHIKLQVQQDQLQVAIQTQVGQSRDIIEQNLPRLREQLAQQGINLGDASVEQQSPREQSNSQQSKSGEVTSHTSINGGDDIIEEQEQWLTSKIPLPAQGIDYYA